MTEVTAKAQLTHLLKVCNQRVMDWFTAIDAASFFIGNGEERSAVENVDHLIRAHKPVTKALKLPKPALRALFGKPHTKSVTYDELCTAYRHAIPRGAQASGRYLPGRENPNHGTERRKKEVLDRFSKASTELVSVAEQWDENELDRYLLPHPILGKLTVREILYFTIYHNLRHASQEGD